MKRKVKKSRGPSFFEKLMGVKGSKFLEPRSSPATLETQFLTTTLGTERQALVCNTKEHQPFARIGNTEATRTKGRGGY